LLFKKEYFAYQEKSEKYLEKLVQFISQNIKDFPSTKTPSEFHYLDSHYIFYNSNKRTIVYVFFEKSGTDYLITGILNNQCKEANGL
jgi:hypothetical protein